MDENLVAELPKTKEVKQVSEVWIRRCFTLETRRKTQLWLTAILDELDQVKERKLLEPSVVKMQELIETNGVVRMYVSQMLEESRGKTRDNVFHRITSVDKLLEVINYIITRAPVFYPFGGLTGAYQFPMSSLFNEMMATEAGESAFRNTAFNDAMTGVLQAWCDYLDSPASREVLNEGKFGWLSPAGQKYTSLDEFVTNPNEPYYGFESFNAFFHRLIKPELRPLSAPDNSKVIVSPNDGTVYQIVSNVQLSTDFWAKGQTYSLINILNNNPMVNSFVGGDMVQTFLSGNDFHRFHSPIDGTILQVEVLQGLTFSQRNAENEPGAGTESLGYEAAVNTRGLIYIKGDDPALKTVCVIPIGITEISSVRFNDDITPNSPVKKGQELGSFSYGGSTLCLLFQPDVVQNFVVQPSGKLDTGGQETSVVRVNAQIATAR